MTLMDLRCCYHGTIKVISSYNGKVLMHNFDTSKHDAFKEIRVQNIRPALRFDNGCFYETTATTIIECTVSQTDYDDVKSQITGGKINVNLQEAR